MKHIDFIEQDIKFGFIVDRNGKTEDLTEKIKACNHELVLTSGLPRDILACKKCGWWSFWKVTLGDLEKYEIQDLRDPERRQ